MTNTPPNHPRSTKFLRIAAVAATLILICLIVVIALDAILPGFFDVLEHGEQDEIVTYIRSFGSTRGILLAFLLQFVQILSIFFPGGPIQIAIGIVFGTFVGFFICHIGYVSANALVFWSARSLGNRLDQLFAGSSHTKRLHFISEAKHPGFVVALACLLPFLPNGLVPYIAARTKIKFWRFLLSVYLGSIPTLFLLCAIGNKLLMGDYLQSALLCALLVIGVLALYMMRNRIFAASERLQSRMEARREQRKRGGTPSSL